MGRHHISKYLFSRWQEAFTPSSALANVVQLAYGVEDGDCKSPSEIAELLDKDLETIGDYLNEFRTQNAMAMSLVFPVPDQCGFEEDEEQAYETAQILMDLINPGNDESMTVESIAKEYEKSPEEIYDILNTAIDSIKHHTFEKKDYGYNGFLRAIEAKSADSFADIVQKIIYAKTPGDEKEKERALALAWERINTLVFLFRRGEEPKGCYTWSDVLEEARFGARYINDMGTFRISAKSTHCPEYEWRTVKNRHGEGYVWQAPNRFELFLMSYALPLTEREVIALYEFCGYYLSAYSPVDNAFRAIVSFAFRAKSPRGYEGDIGCNWFKIIDGFELCAGYPLEGFIKEERKRFFIAEPKEDK